MRRSLCLFLAVLLPLIQGPFLGHSHPAPADAAHDRLAADESLPHLHLDHLLCWLGHHDDADDHEPADDGHDHAALNLPAALSIHAAPPPASLVAALDAVVPPGCDPVVTAHPLAVSSPADHPPSCPRYLCALCLRI
jgi:hypothetical protein